MDQNQEFWETVMPDRYKPGQIVKGWVARVSPFGIFVNLEPGIEGIVHVSELIDNLPTTIDADGLKKVINDLVKPGEQIDLMVLAVRVDDRRIRLSRKRVPT